MKRLFPVEDEFSEWTSNSRIPLNCIYIVSKSRKNSQLESYHSGVGGSFSCLKLPSDVLDPQSLSSSRKREGKGLSNGIRGIIKKASESIRIRRRHIHDNEKRSRPVWRRLIPINDSQRTVDSPSVVCELSSGYEIESLYSPVPGNGIHPPRIPLGFGGSAARAAAAAENRTVLMTSSRIHNDYSRRGRQTFRTSEQQEDRESGIGIAITSIPINRVDSSTTCCEISRVDFISNLPSEIAIQILVYLDHVTLRKIATVSRKWFKISQTQSIWREVFLREQTKTYASSKPIPLGAGLGLPHFSSNNDWKDLYRVREQLKENWLRGAAEAIYLNGHLDSIYCVQFDEGKIITGSRDKTIRIWDLKNYICTLVIGPPSVINSPSFMIGEDGQSRHYAVMPDMTKNIAERNPDTISYPIHHNQSILCLQYDDSILATGSSDGTCIIHDIKNRYRPIRQLCRHTSAVLDLAFDHDHIVTCSKDMSIFIWNRETGTLIKQLRGHTGPVNAVQLRGNIIVSCSGDLQVKLWNIDTGKNIKELAGHTKGLACSQFSEDSRFIASAGNDKSIRIWDANTGETLKSIAAHNNLVRSLHIDSISGRLVSGSYDQDIKVFDMATGATLLDFPKWHSSWVLGAKSDYRRIVSTGQDPKILIMDFGMNIKGIESLES